MPNLLKSLPREILEKEDTKFIYNVLNPLLFEKIKETEKDTTVTYPVTSLLNKDINHRGKFLPEFVFPFNINAREFNVYMSDGQENRKVEYFTSASLMKEMDDLKDFVFFYFGVPGYEFLHDLIRKYYNIIDEFQKNQFLYEENYKKYLETREIRKKKVYKSTYEHFKKLHEEFKDLKDEFDIIIRESGNFGDKSVNQMIDSYARELGYHFKIKSFDNELIFENSKLLKFLSVSTYGTTVKRHIFSGKNIISTQEFSFNNVFELIAIFAMEIFTIREKYNHYLKLLVDNGDGYSMERSEHRRVRNNIQHNVKLSLDSDNLTYFLDEENNKLEIYLYFVRDYRIDESTLKVAVNGNNIEQRISPIRGEGGYGYTIFEYFDENVKYYKITVHDFLIYTLDDEYIGRKIDDIDVSFDAIAGMYVYSDTPNLIYVESDKFLDNFCVYAKNEQTGFYEKINAAYKLKISIEEKEDFYVRGYEFIPLGSSSKELFVSKKELYISYFEYDYIYEPKLYVDFFKYANSVVKFRYNTIMPYVLIDDVIDGDLELEYYKYIDDKEYSTNIHKNVRMDDGNTYKKLFDEIDHMMVMNPYNESNYNYVTKINYGQYLDRSHVGQLAIDKIVEKIPFRDNLKYLNKVQVDRERNLLIFMHRGVQKGVPLQEELKRGFNFENIIFTHGGMIIYHGVEMRDDPFIATGEGVYLKNPKTGEYDLIEASPLEQINLTTREREIFFDMFEMSHCVILGRKKYKVDGLYVDTFKNALKNKTPVLFVESKYGIPRYCAKNKQIVDVDFSTTIKDNSDTHNVGEIQYDADNHILTYKFSENETYVMNLLTIDVKPGKHRQLGMSAFSIFYAGNALPENSNKTFVGRENIYNSMFMSDNIYKIGKNGDIINDVMQHNLLAEQLDLNAADAEKYNLEQEQYLMFKSSTASFKGLESYLRSSLKSISQDIGVSPVYLVQRNRFISEWARTSSVLPRNDYTIAALKDLVADLMETKLLNRGYDDLMDVFKNNEYEKFSLDTNNIHAILVQYILRFMQDDRMLEHFTYYLIHEVWITPNRKRVIDFIKENASEQTVREVSSMTFQLEDEKNKLFYIFVDELSKKNKMIIDSYIPISNYSDWMLYQENNHVKFEKPFKYELIDIAGFITMPVEWTQPLYMIRPLNDDGVFVKRDFRFLDFSIATHSQITYDDAYNEYVDDIKNKLNRPVDYLFETLRALQELSIKNGFDFLSINLVIIKWMVERFIPTFMTTNRIETVEELIEAIKTELTSEEHPNMIVSYNRIKESTVLGDLGSNVQTIFDSITLGDLVTNTTVRLDISSSTELEYLDKIKRPLEHYFDYLFYTGRHDIVTKILALFTEDVIATSLVDLSFAINVKNSKGDRTFDIYEKMIYEIFDEFLPFHSVLDKIIFTIKVMETSSAEAIDKQLDSVITDKMMIDVMLDFAEKVKISVFDTFMTIIGRVDIYSTGLTLCGGHDEIPYDYDRKVRRAGHDIPYHMDDEESYGVDDEWYIINRDRWRHRSNDVYDPPEYADFNWNCGAPPGEFEQVADTYINDYYHIKTKIFERDDRIESHFVDSIPIIDITQGVSENPDINVTEDYLIAIDTTYKIRFYDLDLLGHDDYGLDETWGPADQSALIGMKEAMRQSIMHEFYDKLNVAVLDSIWTDIVVLHTMPYVPGHDEFGIDEDYHQSSPDRLNQELSVMVYDELLTTGFETKYTDMTDISLVDKKLSYDVIADYNELIMGTVVKDTYHVTVEIIANRHFDGEGHFLRPGHDEFVYDEYYHNSANEQRLDNMADALIADFMGDIRIDFGFMRMLPFDPYADLIDQRFYRANQPGSDIQRSRVRDKFAANIHTFSKDIIRVGLMDFYTLDLIAEDTRRKVYEGIEADTFGGDLIGSSIADTLIKRNIHHDFRENIIAIDKYARILNDADIVSIYGANAVQTQRDELFRLELGDTFYSSIKIKQDVDRITATDRDYLKSIKIEEENFTEFKLFDDSIDIRFDDVLRSYYNFAVRASITLTEQQRNSVEQYEFEKTEVRTLERVHYGNRYEFDIDGMRVGMNDSLLELWSNRIHKDSMVLTVTETTDLQSKISEEYNFSIRSMQLHDEYGHMGYTDESLERSIDTRMVDSLLMQVSANMSFDATNAEIYDHVMADVSTHVTDYIDVVIGESLKTYVEMVKRPWIMAEYDTFGHDEYPHVYSGDDDEFDISTKLLESMRIDAYSQLYDHVATVNYHERIFVGHNYNFNDGILSVSMKDDLKIVSVGFSDTMTIRISEPKTVEETSSKEFKEQNLVLGIQDRIWYGYKLEDNIANVLAADSVAVDYFADDTIGKDISRTMVRDWLVTRYVFIDDRPNISLHDGLDDTTILSNPRDEIGVAFVEKFAHHEYLDTFVRTETTKVYITDKVFVDSVTGHREFDSVVDTAADSFDKSSVSLIEKLEYGEGKWFVDYMRILIDNRSQIFERTTDFTPTVNVGLHDDFTAIIQPAPFKDSLGVDTYERMKFGPVFKDKTNVLTTEFFGIKYAWMDDRYGVDQFPHSTDQMEYYNDSSDRQITAVSYDDIKIIDVHMTFGESLIILSADQLKVEDSLPTIKYQAPADGIVVASNDNLMYGVGMYDYIWDAKEWESYGYTVPYEGWSGHLPHDDFPYDEAAHSDQGNDLSQVNTGITENLLYGFDFIFKDTLSVQMNDGFETWSYQSVFKDKTTVYSNTRLATDYITTSTPTVKVDLTKEFMTVSYDFDDKIKTHKFIGYDNNISVEEINIYDKETHQLLETIMRYRLYEGIDVAVNEDLLGTTLFKYDDELSLITDYTAKINLYKAQSDGSVTRSMTVIQDKSSEKVELLFSDGVFTVLKDKLHGTEAFRPDEYLG